MRYAIGMAVAGSIFMLQSSTPQAADPPPSFAKDIKPFLTKYCVECHQGSTAKAKIKVETYNDLLTRSKKGALVVAGKPDQSVLMQVLQGKGSKPMPPKKSTQPAADEIAKVKAWITAGAKNDAKADAGGERPSVVAQLQE